MSKTREQLIKELDALQQRVAELERSDADRKSAEAQDTKSMPTFQYGNLTVDFAGHRATLRDELVSLTVTEYKLLSYLTRNAGRLLTADRILENVWGGRYLGESHLLQVNIARLRKKLKDNARRPVYILTQPGIGYMMKKA